MRGMRTAGSPDQRIRCLKDASPEEFTLGWYSTFIKYKKNNLGSIMRYMTGSGGTISGQNYSNAKTGETTAVIQNCSGGKILKPC